jgi:histidine kinase
VALVGADQGACAFLLGGILMSIRLRLLLSHSTMLVITLVFFLVSALLMLLAITGDIKSIKHLYTSHYSLKPLTEAEENVFLDIKYLAKKQSDQLRNPTTLKKFDQKLERIHSKLVIRETEEIIYSSKLSESDFEVRSLPSFEPANLKVRDTISVDNRFFSYVKFDFYFPNQELGSIYIMKEVSPYAEFTRNLFPIMFALLFLLLIVANGLLSYFVSRSIIKPLYSLKSASEQIREGNLDFKISSIGHDEIGQLSNAFEKMRRKLKDSIELQLQYEENRKELISNISHDLKTPITAIKGYIEGIKDGVADTPEKMDKYLTTIYRKTADLNHMIDDLFLFSKLDLGKLPFAFEEINLNRYMDNFVSDLRFDMEEKKIKVHYETKTQENVSIIADRNKLRRVMTNIIDNSLKYMTKTEKVISILINSKEEFVQIEIRDNGTGIESSSLPFIFNRFYRVDGSRNISTGGSGLGLAIAKQIISEHGGDIWVESELGEGTRVIFTLKKSK